MLAIAFIAGGVLCIALFILGNAGEGECVGTYAVGQIDDDSDDE